MVKESKGKWCKKHAFFNMYLMEAYQLHTKSFMYLHLTTTTIKWWYRDLLSFILLPWSLSECQIINMHFNTDNIHRTTMFGSKAELTLKIVHLCIFPRERCAIYFCILNLWHSRCRVNLKWMNEWMSREKEERKERPYFKIK